MHRIPEPPSLWLILWHLIALSDDKNLIARHLLWFIIKISQFFVLLLHKESHIFCLLHFGDEFLFARLHRLLDLLLDVEALRRLLSYTYVLGTHLLRWREYLSLRVNLCTFGCILGHCFVVHGFLKLWVVTHPCIDYHLRWSFAFDSSGLDVVVRGTLVAGSILVEETRLHQGGVFVDVQHHGFSGWAVGCVRLWRL